MARNIFKKRTFSFRTLKKIDISVLPAQNLSHVRRQKTYFYFLPDTEQYLLDQVIVECSFSILSFLLLHVIITAENTVSPECLQPEKLMKLGDRKCISIQFCVNI
jgi:hypothetical protein